MTMGVEGVVGLDAQLRNLVVDRTYLFEHKRKGPFVGVYRGLKATHAGDPQDAFFLMVDAYTEEGSGQERLANSFIRDDRGRKVRPMYSSKYIRPSLLVSVTSPDAATRKNLAEKFYGERIAAEATAAANGLDEPIYPSLSLPTSQAMQQFAGNAPSSTSPRVLVVSAIGAATVAVPVVAHLIGVI